MAVQGHYPRRIPELEPFVVRNVEPTGVKLGTGAYGEVEEVRIPGAICAAKKMHELLLQSATPQEQNLMGDTFLRECTLLSRLRHPHIVQFLGVCYLPGSRLPLLVMERLFTSLDELLENKDIVIPFDAKLSFLRDVAKGLIFLHGQTPPVIHRDLTARNVLLNTGMVAKIADLGVARIVNIQPGKLAATMTRNPGNIVYMPPEAAEDTARYSAALDMFSYGNLAIFTLTRTFPDLKAATYFDTESGRVVARTEVERRDDLFQQLYKELEKEHELVTLSKQCLSNNPTERPTADQALQRLARVHPAERNWDKTKLELLQDVATAENERVSKELDIDNLNNKVDDYEKQVEDLQKENQSLRQVVESFNEQLLLLFKEVEDKDNENKILERRNRILQQQLLSQELQLQEYKEQEEIDVESVPQCLKEASSAVVLQKSISFLYQHLDPDKVVPMLTKKSLLSTSESKELASYKHGTAKSIALVDKMIRKAGDANLSLIDTLKRIPGQEYIGMRLTQELREVVLQMGKRPLSRDDIAEHFLQLIEDVMVAFDNYPDGVHQLKQVLTSLVLPLGRGNEAALVQPAIYQNSQSTRELFKCMSPYFNLLSTDVLQLLTHLSGCDAAAKAVDNFVAARANSHLVLCSGKQQTESLPSGSSPSVSFECFHKIPLDTLQSPESQMLVRLPEHQSVAIRKGMVRVSVLVNRSVLCFSDYDHILTALCGFFKVPKVALAYIGCAEHPCMLSWVVSPPVYEYMQSVSGNVSGEKMVAQERIISIAVGQHISYKCPTIEESELHEAVYYGLAEKVQSLLKMKHININAMVVGGNTALYVASQNGDKKIAQILIQARAKVDLQNIGGYTALHAASQNGHEKIAQLLIQAGAKVDLQNIGGYTALYAASQNGDKKIAQILIQAGAKVDLQNNGGNTALYAASQKGHEKMVQLLIQAGAKVDLRDICGWTPLMGASENGHDKVVELLLTAGAKVDLQPRYGSAPLMIASVNGNDKMVELLLTAGAKVDLQDRDGWTPLMRASGKGLEKVVELLLTAGAKVDLQSKGGWTPLMRASDKGHEKVVELLLTAGAKVDLKDEGGWTPLMRASGKGHEKVVELLLTAGAKVDLEDKGGWTPLMRASGKDHEKVVELLLTAGVSVNEQNCTPVASHQAPSTSVAGNETWKPGKLHTTMASAFYRREKEHVSRQVMIEH